MLPPTASSEILPPRLRSDDPELPTLATKAAVELDGLRRGKAQALPSVQRLGEMLRNALAAPPSAAHPGREACALMDPSTVVLVARALCQTGQRPGPTTQEVCALAEKMAKKLEDAAMLHDFASAAELLQFCIELAHGAHQRPSYRRDPDLRPFRH